VAGLREGNLQSLGGGGLGRRFVAASRSLVGGQEVVKHAALKVLNSGLLRDERQRAQFIQDLLTLTRARHPNVVLYLDAGEENGEVYCLTELGRGGDSAQLARRFGGLPERVLALIALQIATGLKEVHLRHRLIHRDIKPSSVVLIDEIEASCTRQTLASAFEQNPNLCRITDFGMVNLLLNASQTPQRFLGSPMFASPEQIQEQPMDARCDIYSLGMTLWYLAHGSGPLVGPVGEEIRDSQEIVRRQVSPQEHDLSGVGTEFRKVLSRMVAKRPEERFINVAELIAVLQQYLAAPPSSRSEAVAGMAVTHVEGALESIYTLGNKVASRGGCTTFTAAEIASGKPVLVTAVSGSDEGTPAELDRLSARLCRIGELTMLPACPESLAPVRKVVRVANLLVAIEDLPPQVSLAEVLKARTRMKRPVSFSEAVAILRPVAEAFDYLAQNNEESVSLSCEEIFLSGPKSESVLQDPDTLAATLAEGTDLHVRCSAPRLAMTAGANEGEMPMDPGGTTFGSLQMSADDLHPVPVFARLTYRILNGSEVATAVKLVPEAYVPAVTLSPASNNLIRDLISQRRAWFNARAVLKELCINEAVTWNPKLQQAAVVEVISPGVILSPFATARTTQRLSREEWQPGHVFVCSASGRKVMLPAELPPMPKASSLQEGSPLVVPIRAGRKTNPPQESSQSLASSPVPPSLPTRQPEPRRSGMGVLVWLLLLFLLAGVGMAVWKWPDLEKLMNGKPAKEIAKEDPFVGHAAGEKKVVAGVSFRWCPPTGPEGFQMGSPADEPGRLKDETQHRVVLTKGFWMAETELTQGQWQAVMGSTLRQQLTKLMADNTPRLYGTKTQLFRESHGWAIGEETKGIGIEQPGMPMYWTTWDDAVGYCKAMTDREHLAGTLPTGWEVRLPSEARWEYACRAGTKGAIYGSETFAILGRNNAPALDPIGWYGGNSGVGYSGRGWDRSKLIEKQYAFTLAGSRAVGLKQANPWGFVDTIGNVAEWCQDWYSSYPDGDSGSDPEGPDTGTVRVIRGGAWGYVAAACRAARRLRNPPYIAADEVGFRPVIVPAGK